MLKCFDLTGKAVFITGGSQGLGRAFARAFAQSGADLCLISRSEEKLADTCREMEGYGVRCIYHVADILDSAAVQAAVAKAVAAFGRIDCLINNAAANAQHVPLHEIPIADYRRVIDVNLVGTMIVTQAVVPQMIRQGGGAIVNMCSIAGQVFHGLLDPGAYEASKEGLKALTRSMAQNWVQYNIRVNGIAPGYFLSDANLAACKRNPATEKTLAAQVPMQRWGQPDEIGPVAVFLCSDAASYIQGTVVTVDGGRTFR
ncbi:MAG: glucose 1-dehydrogenase [Oscillospiraceae bacterium]|nr:glucose 1-dehydrogenase [Oscillospiraceae bacterium]